MIRKHWLSVSAMLFVGMVVIWISCSSNSTDPVVIDIGGPLVSAYISGDQAPVLDGTLDAAWDMASEQAYPVEDEHGNLKLVRMKALIDTTNDEFYLLAVWKDADESIRPDFWEFNPTSHIGGQDFFYAIFDDGENGDVAANCAKMCHYNVVDQDSTADMMYNPGPSLVDAWLWKAGVTNPQGTLEDIHYPADDGTREDDVQTNAAYIANDNFKGSPRWMHKDAPNHPTDFLFMADTVPFRVIGTDFDSIPGWALVDRAQWEGPSKWDVDAKGVYDNLEGTWTLEMRRALVTGHADDVQFVKGQSINCSIGVTSSIFENTPYPHSGSKEFKIQL